MVNIRTKGASAEREVATMLNGIIVQVMTGMGASPDDIEAAAKCVQRNQNQSAVGGCDLTNVFGISVEVKRQEQVSLGTWWAQTTKAAERNNELPLLIWRQSRKPWRVRTYAWLALPGGQPGQYNRQKMIVADFDVDTFKVWFAEWVRCRLEQGWELRT